MSPIQTPWKSAGNPESPTELFIHSHDLGVDGGAAFVEQIRGVLSDPPGTLLVNLIAGSQLRLSSVTTILRARWEAKQKGWRFKIRPTNRAVRNHLAGIGLGAVLAGSP